MENKDDSNKKIIKKKIINKDKPRTNKMTPGSKKIVKATIITLIVLICSGLIAFTLIIFCTDLIGLGGNTDKIIIDIPEGSSTSEIADILKEKNIIDHPTFFRIYAKLNKSDKEFVPGQHILSDAMPYSEIAKQLKSNNYASSGETVRLTIKEGMTLDETAKLLEKNKICSADEFIEAFNKNSGEWDFEKLVEKKDLRYYLMEGYLFPDTYDFTVNQNPLLVAQRIKQTYMQKVYTPYYNRIKDSGMSFDEVMTLASMVQAEAPDFENMQNVASVFLNRLNSKGQFPKLESDPTKKYVKSTIRPNLKEQNEVMCNAYDTYEGQGLPPGPICNPGVEAIEAVLNPAKTDYYYFCANIKTKQIYYAKTLKEQEANLEKASIK